MRILAGFSLDNFGVCVAKKWFITASSFDPHDKAHCSEVANANLLCRDLGEKTIDIYLQVLKVGTVNFSKQIKQRHNLIAHKVRFSMISHPDGFPQFAEWPKL